VLLRLPLSIYNELVPGQAKTPLKCPICKKAVAKASEDFPFCSERCRTIDLGKWASGQYVVSSQLQDTDDEEMQNLRDASDED
jgi:endogenous inhibitor of DNA gyrase (YacG/DUF329 family)